MDKKGDILVKIYDISQEVFSCQVFSGDPVPKKTQILSIEKGDVCNLTEISMCAHNGTHIDAPYHFINGGKSVDKLNIESLVGPCFVAIHSGVVGGDDAKKIIEKARVLGSECAKRILLKGDLEVSLDASQVFAKEGILLLGNESQTVGPKNAPMEVHLELLGKEIVLLEGIRLGEIDEGKYFLNAMPLNLGGADGAPCRAILIDFEGEEK